MDAEQVEIDRQKELASQALKQRLQQLEALHNQEFSRQQMLSDARLNQEAYISSEKQQHLMREAELRIQQQSQAPCPQDESNSSMRRDV